jgi:hypothetical protein
VLSFNLRIGLILSRETEDTDPVRQGFHRVMERFSQILKATPHTCSFITRGRTTHELSLLRDYLTTWGESGASLLKIYTDESDTNTRDSLPAFFPGGDSLVTVLPASPAASELHLTAGEEAVVRACDILILAFRRREATGGYAKYLIRSARIIGRSLFAINEETGAVIEIRHNDRFLETIENLNTFNRERLSVPVYEQAVGRYTHIILRKLIKSVLPPEIVRPLCRTMLPQFARANQLAKQYHRHYLMAGNVGYGFSILAVLAVTFQVVFFPQDPRLIRVEAFAVAVTLAFIIGAKTGE